MKTENELFNRQKRSPEKFDVIDLFDAIGRGRKFSIRNDADKRRFSDIVYTSLNENTTDTILYGRRVEAMFSYMVASLGKCNLIKKEDCGDVFAKTNIEIPDYRLVLSDGRQVLIEVKNFHQKGTRNSFEMKKSYIDGLINYATLMDTNLNIAIFWSKWGLWTLVNPTDFEINEKKVSIKFTTALEKNLMIEIGDYVIATTPPIAIRLISDKKKPHDNTKSSLVEFTVGDVQLLCASKLITEDNEKRIILALILYGNWNEKSEVVLVTNTAAQIDYIEFSYSPTEIQDNEENYQQDFRMIDSMSTVISRQYISLTTDDGKISKLTPDIAPGALGFIIPTDYHSDNLPILRFYIHPKEL